MKDFGGDRAVLESWEINARPWTRAIREREITSRELVTNRAIVETLQSLSVARLLDIGCGEGWLCRLLRESGTACLGIDAIPELVQQASELGGHYQVVRYEDLLQTDLGPQFDAAVCNFSLIGKQASETVFRAAPTFLSANGYLVVQTLHPCTSCGELPYEDGWREGSWSGFADDFRQPAPWYFRTLESWCALYEANGFESPDIIEPRNPETGDKQSLILVGSLNR